ncbi:MAG: NlpC/P60 family protein [Alphaproteobacteria bacterium]
MATANELDPRIHPWRPEIAAKSLEGVVTAARFVEGETANLCIGQAGLFKDPRPDAEQVSELRFGERFCIYDRIEGYAWGQCGTDEYVGWVAETALVVGEVEITHLVRAQYSHIYAVPNIRSQIVELLPIGARLAVEREQEGYAVLLGGRGLVPAQHLLKRVAPVADWVAIAEQFLGAPYLWGGKTARGIDCSGLVQVALEFSGLEAPRDTDLQAMALGHAVARSAELQRGDIVFWQGHVGIMLDGTYLLHANAHHMMVAAEPLEVAEKRISANEYGPITVIKRL